MGKVCKLKKVLYGLKQYPRASPKLCKDLVTSKVKLIIHILSSILPTMGKMCKLKKALYGLKQYPRAFPGLCKDLVTRKVKLIIHFLSSILLKER
jgi:hypothetical protein